MYIFLNNSYGFMIVQRLCMTPCFNSYLHVKKATKRKCTHRFDAVFQLA